MSLEQNALSRAECKHSKSDNRGLPPGTEHGDHPDAMHQAWKAGQVTIVHFFQFLDHLCIPLKIFQPMLPSRCSKDFAQRHEFVLG